MGGREKGRDEKREMGEGGRETDRQGGTDRQMRGRGSILLTVRQSHTKGV